MANSRVGNSGNVALEMVLAVALSVTFLFPAIESVSQVFRSRIELNQSFSVLSRIFQKSPANSLRYNLNNAVILLQKKSKQDLRIKLFYQINSDGITNKVTIRSGINSGVPLLSRLQGEREVKRADYVP